MSTIIETKYGRAGLNYKGYYRITSRKEGNHHKQLHRLIYEDFYKVCLLPFVDLHHIDGNKQNNSVNNLKPIYHKEHTRKHLTGKKLSKEHRQKISENRKGIKDKHSTKINKSKSKNTTGYFRVHKQNKKDCKQGFIWCYRYYNGYKRVSIVSTDITKLKEKVLAKGLKWIEFVED